MDLLSEAYEPLAEGTAARVGPRGYAVLSSDAGGVEQGRVLQDPRDNRVLYWDDEAQAALEAQLQRPELAAQDLDADLRAAVALAVVRRGVLRGDRLHLVHVALHHGESLVHEGDQGLLVVRLDDHPDVAEPGDGLNYEVDDVPVLVDALAGDDVAEHVFEA